MSYADIMKRKGLMTILEEKDSDVLGYPNDAKLRRDIDSAFAKRFKSSTKGPPKWLKAEYHIHHEDLLRVRQPDEAACVEAFAHFIYQVYKQAFPSGTNIVVADAMDDDSRKVAPYSVAVHVDGEMYNCHNVPRHFLTCRRRSLRSRRSH